jgi:hypothetical protein
MPAPRSIAFKRRREASTSIQLEIQLANPPGAAKNTGHSGSSGIFNPPFFSWNSPLYNP